MSKRAADCAVTEGRLPASSGGTFPVLEVLFKSSSNEQPDPEAARRKILAKKPQEHYVRLQFMPKSFPSPVLVAVCVIRNLKVRIQDSLCNF